MKSMFLKRIEELIVSIVAKIERKNITMKHPRNTKSNQWKKKQELLFIKS